MQEYQRLLALLAELDEFGLSISQISLSMGMRCGFFWFVVFFFWFNFFDGKFYFLCLKNYKINQVLKFQVLY